MPAGSGLGLARAVREERAAAVAGMARRHRFVARPPARGSGAVWAAQRRRPGGRVLLELDPWDSLTVTVEGARGPGEALGRWWVAIGPGVPLEAVERLLEVLEGEVAARWRRDDGRP